MTQTTLKSRNDAPGMRGNEAALPRQMGQWELVELASEGSVSQVYRAGNARSAAPHTAPYALKILRSEWENDLGAIRLLVREAFVGRSVSHPHLISVLQTSLAQRPRFLVLPWLEGRTLQAQLAAGRKIDVPEALWIARQVAEALGALHAAGWIHGDVKPANIFVASEGHVTLIDLGFARRGDEAGSAVDRCVLGTCNYMAPEWIVSALRADIRSDIYSLGVVLFEAFSGRLPFSGKNLAELASQHVSARPPDLKRLASDLPVAVVELVGQMIAKEPLRRPQTPDELIDRMAELEIATFSQREWR